MKNFKKIGIVFAVLVVIIVIAVVFRDNWLPILDSFIVWIQTSIGFKEDQAWHIIEATTPAVGGGSL